MTFTIPSDHGWPAAVSRIWLCRDANELCPHSRLSEDLTEDELARAKVLITARRQTRGELTRVRAGEIAEDLFYFGEPRQRDEETARIEQVTLDDIRNYLAAHPPQPRPAQRRDARPDGAAGGKDGTRRLREQRVIQQAFAPQEGPSDTPGATPKRCLLGGGKMEE